MKTDSELQRDVLDELKWEPSVDAAHLGVAVKDGIVTLTGHVTSYAQKYVAERAAKRVLGVRAVANELDVKLPGSSRRTDEDIAAAAVNALKSNLSIPSDRIKVIVSDGLVKLEGEVEWQFQKDAAARAVRYLPGVIGVTNLIIVKPRVAPSEIKAKIEDALKRSAETDARRISVELEGGKVTLRGIVRSMGRKRGSRTYGLVCAGRLQRREPHHGRTVMSCRDGGDPMSATGLDVFDTTVQKTNIWLNDLMKVLGWQDRHKAYLALRATLHALRDRLTVDEVAHLGCAAPDADAWLLLRGLGPESQAPARAPQEAVSGPYRAGVPRR